MSPGSVGGMRRAGWTACAILASVWSLPLHGSPAIDSAASLPPVDVKDLAYGDVLFHYFQDDYFGALTRLEVAKDQGRMPHHADDAELLEGGLYLSLGQHREAGEIFARVLDRPRVPPAVRDRARFYLGKVWFQRGYYEEAASVLDRHGTGTLPEGMEAERRLLLAETYLAQKRYEDAVGTLSGWKAPAGWAGYAEFNRGIALLRSGRFDEGARQLDALGQRPARGAEGLALRDKANLALGFALLQQGQAGPAEAALNRVRLDGPLSTKALLGAGWALSSSGKYEDALTPWLELRSRNILDAAVQESYLAVPYAYSKLGANSQAAEYYESAVQEFEAEAGRIDQSIAAIRDGKLLDTIARNDVKGDMSWAWQLQHLPEAPESRYLYHLMAQNDFQEGLKNYRQLLYLQRNLDTWSDNVDAFDNMIDTRRARDDIEIPAAQRRLAATDLEQLRQRHTDIEARLAAADASGDVVALGTAKERETYSKVEQLEALAAASTEPDAGDARDKVQLMKGVLYWQMHAGYKARVWAARKNDREALSALHEAEGRWSKVNDAIATLPGRDEVFAQRVATLGPRLNADRERIARLRAAEGLHLADLAVGELQEQRHRLDAYLLQARYALATLYDRAANPPHEARPESPSPADDEGRP